MADKIIDDTYLNNIANAIIDKGGATGPIQMQNMAQAVLDIPTGADWPTTAKYDEQTNASLTLTLEKVIPQTSDWSAAAYKFQYNNNIKKVIGTTHCKLNNVYIFDTCINIQQVDLSTTSGTIGNYCFNGCSNLTTVILGNGINILNQYCFCNCKKLATINLSNIVTTGQYAFQNCIALTSVDLSNLTTLGNGSFSGCTNLQTVILNSNLTSISDYCFSSCTNLSEIELPSSIKVINTYAFNLCTSLDKKFILNSSMTKIQSCAFYDCSKLELEFEEGFTCDKLTAGSLKGTIKMVTFATTMNNFTADYIETDNLVTKFNLKSEGIAAYAQATFSKNSSSPTYHWERLFIDGEIATTLVIPEGVTTISQYAFIYCYRDNSLITIDLPSTLTSLGASCFASCKTKTLYCRATIPPTYGTSCLPTSTITVVYVPAESVDIYKSTTGWSTMSSKIQAIPSNE